MLRTPGLRPCQQARCLRRGAHGGQLLIGPSRLADPLASVRLGRPVLALPSRTHALLTWCFCHLAARISLGAALVFSAFVVYLVMISRTLIQAPHSDGLVSSRGSRASAHRARRGYRCRSFSRTEQGFRFSQVDDPATARCAPHLDAGRMGDGLDQRCCLSAGGHLPPTPKAFSAQCGLGEAGAPRLEVRGCRRLRAAGARPRFVLGAGAVGDCGRPGALRDSACASLSRGSCGAASTSTRLPFGINSCNRWSPLFRSRLPPICLAMGQSIRAFRWPIGWLAISGVAIAPLPRFSYKIATFLVSVARVPAAA